jgi:hypothetical protein
MVAMMMTRPLTVLIAEVVLALPLVDHHGTEPWAFEAATVVAATVVVLRAPAPEAASRPPRDP